LKKNAVMSNQCKSWIGWRQKYYLARCSNFYLWTKSSRIKTHMSI